MLDHFNRKINYLRISVTDRCNLRCQYCMPNGEFHHKRHEDILRYEEIQEVVKVSVSLGIDKIRLTGGEPLVRKDIVQLVEMIASVGGVKDIALTTNGIFLDKFAQRLSDAGLHRINISLDTINPEKYALTTGGGDVNKVLKGIEAAKLAGLSPIKINCVIKTNEDEPDALAVKEYCIQNGLQARFIEEMNLKTGQFAIVHGGSGGDCKNCNRLRLTSDGKMKPCLFSDIEFDIRKYGIKEAIELALNAKPEKGICSVNGDFYNIGG
jgi:GTP 3',8-cyclase